MRRSLGAAVGSPPEISARKHSTQNAHLHANPHAHAHTKTRVHPRTLAKASAPRQTKAFRFATSSADLCPSKMSGDASSGRGCRISLGSAIAAGVCSLLRRPLPTRRPTAAAEVEVAAVGVVVIAVASCA
eukprot:2420295-Pleurochrysis_carterae.AAC.1